MLKAEPPETVSTPCRNVNAETAQTFPSGWSIVRDRDTLANGGLTEAARDHEKWPPSLSTADASILLDA